ncbi:putative ATP-grasp enzyme [Aciduliprofundum sp. MAR08-339]|uniref:carboxylate--amine ligase n=1 Tax=Aciduliprofundum sp. (strain MAR08-339) TaxID=673860 RepID=UPI0002A48DD1|nr:putative ATP-grasp enzyme [Aciduliprofundum sp. MAR08-339]
MILVTGGSRRATLTIVRSLGRKGLKISVGDHTKLSTASLSKYSTNKFLYPNPQKMPIAFFNNILSIIRSKKYDVIIPVHDFEILPIIKNKNIIEKYSSLPFVDFDTFMKTLSKWETLKIANSVGVKIPRTYRPLDKEDLRKIKKDMKYPVVVKPISQTLWDPEKGAKTRYVTTKNYINNDKDLEKFFSKIKNVKDYLIQEYVEGQGAGTSFLFNKGKMRAYFSYIRLREYPITGGPSTLRMSIKNDEMVDAGKRLLEKLNWHGVAMVEFKLTKKGPVLMEINGRFWGSLALAYHAGVDFPYLLYKLAVDGDVNMVREYKTGVLCRWLIPGDILNFYFRLKTERKDNSYVFKEFFRFRGTYYDYIDLDDPLPVIGALITSGRYFVDYLKGKRTISGEYR